MTCTPVAPFCLQSLNVSESEASGVDSWHGLMEAQQGPAVNNLNNPIEPAVQQVNIKVTKPESPNHKKCTKSTILTTPLLMVQQVNFMINITI